jgi:hypothetical protein
MYTNRLQAHRNLQYTNARQRGILSHVPFAPAAATEQVYKATVGAAETQARDSEIEAEVSLSNKMKVES